MSWLVPVLLVASSVAALLDCWSLPRPLVPGPPVLVWTAAFVALPLIAPITWFAVRHAGATRAEDEPPAAVRGPDDDPEFLRRISRRGGGA